ncbi:MAG TPA: hypothetical protein VFF80_05025, partial [Bacillota bacterium]|nr:hypothetical protein [Bacillota bacterium]
NEMQEVQDEVQSLQAKDRLAKLKTELGLEKPVGQIDLEKAGTLEDVQVKERLDKIKQEMGPQ